MTPDASQAASPTPEYLPLDARAIESEVTRLWREAAESAAGGLVRATSQTVLVMATDPAQRERVESVLAQGPSAHPCRIILVGHGETEPRATVSASCRPPSDGRGPVCWEEIHLGGARTALDRIMSAARGLVIPNLPVQVWWPSEIDFASPLFEQTVEIGDRIIVDSSRFADPLKALAAYADRAEEERGAVGFVDLAWRRIEPWRLLLAQFFDPPVDRQLLNYIEAVLVRYHPTRAGGGLAEALLLVGWLAGRLGWTPPAAPLGNRDVEHALFDDGGRVVRIELRRVASTLQSNDLVSIELQAALDERTATYRILRRDETATTVAEVDGERREAVVPLATPNDAALLVRELATFGRDRIYEEALQVVRALGKRALPPATV
jgi:glucose-6-phosphate dehydrogenase assembly protein OpcA